MRTFSNASVMIPVGFMIRVGWVLASYGELHAEYPTYMSHVATQLDEDALKFYEERAKELRQKWSYDERSASPT